MILIIDDDKTICLTLRLLFSKAGYDAETASSPDEAIPLMRSREYDLILMDMNFSKSTTGEEGIELLRKARILLPETPVILITAWGSITLAVEGMRRGAFDFITKPFNTAHLLQQVETAITLGREARAEASSRRDCSGDAGAKRFDRCGIIGESPEMKAVLETVARIAPTDAPVLILGENGTGKELIANAIHANSRRSFEPFVKVNLGGIPMSLFESEMFGHVKGAFTGAVTARKGSFELADKGTIFLDEIGDLDPASQVKMLRALQDHTFQALGDSRVRRSDLRVVSATNADLPRMVAERTFREDLFYRINLITLRLPPLRERRSDIPLLADHFAERFARELGIETPRFSADAMQLLTALPWQGNIRELKNTVERAILTRRRPTVERADITTETGASPVIPPDPAAPPLTLDEKEKAAVADALARHGHNLSRTAAALGISRQSLYRRIEKYGL